MKTRTNIGDGVFRWHHFGAEAAGIDLCDHQCHSGFQHAFQSDHTTNQSDRDSESYRRPHPDDCRIYLINALIYGLLALIIALPLGAIVAHQITVVFLGLFNIDYNQFQISQQAVLFQVASALFAPLLAGLPPTLKGAQHHSATGDRQLWSGRRLSFGQA